MAGEISNPLDFLAKKYIITYREERSLRNKTAYLKPAGGAEMENFFKKMARFSLRHPIAGRMEIYPWIVLIIIVSIALTAKEVIDFSSWSLFSIYLFVAILGSVLIILFIPLMFLTTFVDISKSVLPEVVIPRASEIGDNYPEKRIVIDRLIAHSLKNDDASYLADWLFFFEKGRENMARMRKIESQVS